MISFLCAKKQESPCSYRLRQGNAIDGDCRNLLHWIYCLKLICELVKKITQLREFS